jgi:hypothetical protein
MVTGGRLRPSQSTFLMEKVKETFRLEPHSARVIDTSSGPLSNLSLSG